MLGQNQSQTVLIVDDDQDLRMLLAEFLSAEGFEVLEAGDGVEALRLVELSRPDAMLLDIVMPRLGGLGTLERVRALDPDISVIIMTATLDPALLRLAISSGAAAVLTKPLVLEDVAAALRWPPGDADREAPPTAAPRPVASTKKILVVDDEPDVRAMLAELLRADGYDVRVAADGASALEAFVSDPPDVMLLDVRMPDLSGIDVLASIRATNTDAKVIMITGATRLNVANQAFEHGVFDYIAKPVDPAYLELSIEAALMQKRLESD